MDRGTSWSFAFACAVIGLYAPRFESARLTTKSNPYWAARLTMAALRAQVEPSPLEYSLLRPNGVTTEPKAIDEAAAAMAELEKPLTCDVGGVMGTVLTIRCQLIPNDDAERSRLSFDERKTNNLLDAIQRTYKFRGTSPLLQIHAGRETLIVPFEAFVLWCRDYDVSHSLSLLDPGRRLVSGADAALELGPPKRTKIIVPPPRIDERSG